MLSPRTQLALVAYSAIHPSYNFLCADNPVPNYSAIRYRDCTRPRCLKFIELDVDTWQVPRMRRSCNVFDIIVIWAIACAGGDFYMCTLEIDVETLDRSTSELDWQTDPLFVTKKHVYIPSVPLNHKLSDWLNGPVSIVHSNIPNTWSIHPLPAGPRYGPIARKSKGRVPQALVRK
jgi:hypothetical protein